MYGHFRLVYENKIITMTRDKARELLNKYLEINPIPIIDCVIEHNIDEYALHNEHYTFKYLMCLVYDLESVKLPSETAG